MKARWVGSHVQTVFVFAVTIALLSACGAGNAKAARSGSKSAQAVASKSSTDSGGGAAIDPHPYRGSDKIIASESAAAKSVTFDIIGSQGGVNSGFNFNGFANGDMIIKVPEGWKVTMDFRVESSLPHSAIIVPFKQRDAFNFTLAFAGAGVLDYSSGITKGDPPAHFSFTADKAGTYALVCAVPGHDTIGMWDELDVVKGLAKPEVLVK